MYTKWTSLETQFTEEELAQVAKYAEEFKDNVRKSRHYKFDLLALGQLRFKVLKLRARVRFRGPKWEDFLTPLKEFYKDRSYLKLPDYFIEALKEVSSSS